MNPNPFLQYRHAIGLGDFIACTLHSKYINPITIFITGKDGLCTTCDARRNSLNILFPIPFWKLFYKTEKDMDDNIKRYLTYEEKDLKEALIDSKYDNSVEPDNDEEKYDLNFNKKIKKIIPNSEDIENYEFINSSDVELDNYILRTTVYKKV